MYSQRLGKQRYSVPGSMGIILFKTLPKDISQFEKLLFTSQAGQNSRTLHHDTGIPMQVPGLTLSLLPATEP